MTTNWIPVEAPLITMGMPTTWEILETGDDRVVVIAEPQRKDATFRANAVVLVRESTETIVELGARCIAQAHAYSGWSHVYSDMEWNRDDAMGRVVHYLYEASGVCVAVAQYVFSTGSRSIEVTGSCDVVDLLAYDEMFNMIASSTEMRVHA
ncbi:hypothetical protein [Clavibacter sp. CT19]|nr:hypothetical protein [Clavibacter sp. CT19]